MHTSFENARKTFQAFKQRIESDPELRDQLEAAITILRSSYNTAIRENRFIVGGAVEHMLVAACNGAGLPAQHVGAGNTRIDIRVRTPTEEGSFSVKASFSSMNVRLINTLGSGEIDEWEEPTLFLFANVGIVYADPALLPDSTRSDGDARILVGQKMREYINGHPELIVPMRFEKPHAGAIASSKTASEDVARNIVKNFHRLSLP